MEIRRSKNRTGLAFLGAPEVRQMVQLAQLAEDHGFESVWMAETRLTRDGIAPCAAIAIQTARIKIGTGIVNVYTRGAALIAISFLNLSLFPNIAQETQLPADLIERARAAFNKGGPEAAATFIDDDVVDYLTAAGTPAECRNKINEYRAAGVQIPILFPLDLNVKMAIETLGPNSPDAS